MRCKWASGAFFSQSVRHFICVFLVRIYCDFSRKTPSLQARRTPSDHSGNHLALAQTSAISAGPLACLAPLCLSGWIWASAFPVTWFSGPTWPPPPQRLTCLIIHPEGNSRTLLGLYLAASAHRQSVTIFCRLPVFYDTTWTRVQYCGSCHSMSSWCVILYYSLHHSHNWWCLSLGPLAAPLNFPLGVPLFNPGQSIAMSKRHHLLLVSSWDGGNCDSCPVID